MENIPKHQLFQLVGPSQMKAIDRRDPGIQPAGTKVLTEYVNHTAQAITIQRRDGTSSLIPPNLARAYNFAGTAFMVRVTHTLSRGEAIENINHLASRVELGDSEAIHWTDAYNLALTGLGNTGLNATVEYVLSLRDIVDAGGIVYMPETDLVINIGGEIKTPHPYERGSRNDRALSDILPDTGDSTMVFMIKAVDNGPGCRRGTRYINLAGSVYTVPIEKDTRYADGIHFISRAPTENGAPTTEIVTRTYTFEEADETFGLFKSVEEATEGGKMTDMAKLKVEESLLNKRITEAKIRNVQAMEDVALSVARSQLATMKLERERKEADRRNFADSIKTIATIMTACVAIVGLMKK